MSDPTDIRTRRPVKVSNGGDGGGNGNLVNYRLGEIERRLGSLESEASGIRDACVTIKAELKILMWAFGIAAVLASIFIHLMIR